MMITGTIETTVMTETTEMTGTTIGMIKIRESTYE